MLRDAIDEGEDALLGLARREDVHRQAAKLAQGDPPAPEIRADGSLLQLADLLLDAVGGLAPARYEPRVERAERFTERVEGSSDGRPALGERRE